jgi:hypothetical protein
MRWVVLVAGLNVKPCDGHVRCGFSPWAIWLLLCFVADLSSEIMIHVRCRVALSRLAWRVVLSISYHILYPVSVITPNAERSLRTFKVTFTSFCMAATERRGRRQREGRSVRSSEAGMPCCAGGGAGCSCRCRCDEMTTATPTHAPYSTIGRVNRCKVAPAHRTICR